MFDTRVSNVPRKGHNFVIEAQLIWYIDDYRQSVLNKTCHDKFLLSCITAAFLFPIDINIIFHEFQAE